MDTISSITPTDATPAPPNIWIFGDSIVAGSSGLINPAIDCWPTRLNARLVGDQVAPVVTNHGIGGATVMAGGTVDLSTYVPNFVSSQTIKPSLIILSAGANDVFQTANMGALEWAMFTLFGNASAAGNGCPVFWTTLHPVCAGSLVPAGWVPALTQRIQAVNVWLHTMYPHNLIDFWTAEAQPDNTGYANPLYKADGLHPNQWGALRCSDAVNLSLLSA